MLSVAVGALEEDAPFAAAAAAAAARALLSKKLAIALVRPAFVMMWLLDLVVDSSSGRQWYHLNVDTRLLSPGALRRDIAPKKSSDALLNFLRWTSAGRPKSGEHQIDGAPQIYNHQIGEATAQQSWRALCDNLSMSTP